LHGRQVRRGLAGCIDGILGGPSTRRVLAPHRAADRAAAVVAARDELTDLRLALLDDERGSCRGVAQASVLALGASSTEVAVAAALAVQAFGPAAGTVSGVYGSGLSGSRGDPPRRLDWKTPSAAAGSPTGPFARG